MSDYYYLKDKEDDSGLSAILGDDYISALLSISRKHGIKITDEMVLKEVWGKKSPKNHKSRTAKTNLYIDGTNLFAGQNELFGSKRHLSFQFLVKEIRKFVAIKKIYFYASYMNKTGKSGITYKQLNAAEALFYRDVKQTPDVVFYKGHRSVTSGKEKGVDVHLAVDIVRDVFLGNCDSVAIMTGDADLIYPIEIVKALNATTYAIFLPNRFSLEMAYKTRQAFVLNFFNKFHINRRLPKQFNIISIKKPRTMNIRGK